MDKRTTDIVAYLTWVGLLIALIFGVIRAERFSEGILLVFLKNGSIIRWLERLKTLDADGKNVATK